MNNIEKVSQIKVTDIADYLGIYDATAGDQNELNTYLNIAIQYVSDYTGIPKVPHNEGEKVLDDYPSFVLAVFVLIQDMYDTKALYIDKTNVNKVVSSILDMHRKNYVY